MSPRSPSMSRRGRAGRIGESIDLVGHDIGGSTVLTVAMTRPDLLRSWVSDSLGALHPDYVWHDLAEGWQTPGVGGRSVEFLLGGAIRERAARVVRRGITEPRRAPAG